MLRRRKISVKSRREDSGSFPNTTCHGHCNLSQEQCPKIPDEIYDMVKEMATSAMHSKDSWETLPHSETYS
jgi:hypothetical protein